MCLSICYIYVCVPTGISGLEPARGLRIPWNWTVVSYHAQVLGMKTKFSTRTARTHNYSAPLQPQLAAM